MFVSIEYHLWNYPPFHDASDVSKDIRLVQDHWHHCSLQHLAASSCPSSTVPSLRRRLDLHGPPSQTAMALLTVQRQLAAGAEVRAVSMGQSQVQDFCWLEVMAWSWHCIILENRQLMMKIMKLYLKELNNPTNWCWISFQSPHPSRTVSLPIATTHCTYSIL